MASSSDSEDDSFMAVDQEEAVLEGTMEQDEDPHPALEAEEMRHNRSMSELPEEVLEYILSFLSPYQEHKTAALVCKQWYRLIKGVAHQCYHGFIKAVQEGHIQWESRTYPYPGTPITQRFSHISALQGGQGVTFNLTFDIKSEENRKGVHKGISEILLGE